MRNYNEFAGSMHEHDPEEKVSAMRLHHQLIGFLLAATLAPAAARSAPPPASDQPVRLFDATSAATGRVELQLRADGLDMLRSGEGQVQVEEFALTQDFSVALDLHPFSVVSNRTEFVINRRSSRLAFDPARITLLRGEIQERPGSHVFLALSDLGVAGRFDLGPGEPSFVLRGDNAARGLVRGPVRAVEAGFGAPPLADLCRVEMVESGVAAPLLGPATPTQLRHIQLAIETDHEFFQLFVNAEDAAAYIVALYGAVSDVYQRDLNSYIELTFVRLWDTADDLFNQSNPLVPFRDYWNQNMQFVTRDTAQFLTGRRNLPYGGVAYYPGLCNDFAYSIAGYILGSFVDPEAPSVGNWDLIVAAHELGHNCGTLHTHDYGLDSCDVGGTQRGGIMSYCHTTPGGNANIDLGFRTELRSLVAEQLSLSECIAVDCNQNGSADMVDIAIGTSLDTNQNGVPDECEDCNANGVLDPADIAAGAPDMNANGVPDDCEPDCNDNGVPDDLDISGGTSVDAYADGVPDECQADCNNNLIADYNEIQANMGLDVNRNAVLDSCEDCDENGATDLAELAGGMNVWLAGETQTFIREFHGGSGAPVKASQGGVVAQSRDVLVASDRTILVSSGIGNKVARFDPVSGSSLGDFVASGSGGLNSPFGMTFDPDGHLLVASSGTGKVLKYHGTTGVFLGVFVDPGPGSLFAPVGLAVGPDDHLYISTSDHAVLKFHGASGAFLGTFVSHGSGGLNQPRGLLFKPDGNLLVASFGSNAVLEYDGVTGAFLGRFDKGGLLSGFWGLQKPWTLRLNPRADTVLVSANVGNAAVHSYDLTSGVFLRSFYILSQDMPGPTAFDVLPPAANDCNMNFVPDNCEIASGASLDVNNNGIPDECESSVPGDATGDGLVNVQDLLAVINAWGACPAPPALCPADLDGDGQVGVTDLLLVINNWSS